MKPLPIKTLVRVHDDETKNKVFHKEIADKEFPDLRDLTVAESILTEAIETMAQRAAERGVTIERAMPRIVKAFNAVTGHDLSERDGNTFMIILKLVRAEQSPKRDDYVDGASYMALCGEAAEKQAADNQKLDGGL